MIAATGKELASATLRPSDVARFNSRHTRLGDDDCWLWDSPHKTGYGQVSIKGKNYWAHRVAWVIANGLLPAGFDVAHTCHTTACVNPKHLELRERVEHGRKDAMYCPPVGKLDQDTPVPF